MGTSVPARAAIALHLQSYVPGGGIRPGGRLPSLVDRDDVTQVLTAWLWDALRESDDPAAVAAEVVLGYHYITADGDPLLALRRAFDDFPPGRMVLPVNDRGVSA